MIILEYPPMDKDGAMNDDKIKKLKEMCKKTQSKLFGPQFKVTQGQAILI